MRASQVSASLPSASATAARERLRSFLKERQGARRPVEEFEQFEHELHDLFAAAEAEVVAEELARCDVDLPAVEIDGVLHRRVLRAECTYLATAGQVRVMRSLYSTRADGDRAVCPMELRAGIVEGFWTPRAAKQAAWVVAHLTPYEGADLFRTLGGMAPSKSSLDRLPKALSQRWEGDRVTFEAELRAAEQVPEEAVTVAVSLDGIRLPLKEGQRTEKRAKQKADGKETRGPAGYSEATCATLSFYDAEGKRLLTRRIGRMPEARKVTLKAMLTAELDAVLHQRGDLQIVKIADGAPDNWTYLGLCLPDGTEILDFYHAAEHVQVALQAAYGETNPKTAAQFEKLRLVLRDEAHGVDKVLRALRHLRDRYPNRGKIGQALRFIRRMRHKMDYASYQARNFPIGSGVMEATCKTLVSQRLRRSGMRWSHAGGQAVLTLRSLAQSHRFERGWYLLARTYKTEVKPPAKILELRAWRR